MYVVYTISHGESVCGCAIANTLWIYDLNGNLPMKFEKFDAADIAGRKAMIDRNHDSYEVLYEYR